MEVEIQFILVNFAVSTTRDLNMCSNDNHISQLINQKIRNSYVIKTTCWFFIKICEQDTIPKSGPQEANNNSSSYLLNLKHYGKMGWQSEWVEG